METPLQNLGNGPPPPIKVNEGKGELKMVNYAEVMADLTNVHTKEKSAPAPASMETPLHSVQRNEPRQVVVEAMQPMQPIQPMQQQPMNPIVSNSPQQPIIESHLEKDVLIIVMLFAVVSNSKIQNQFGRLLKYDSPISTKIVIANGVLVAALYYLVKKYVLC
jgi:hypothetical protein